MILLQQELVDNSGNPNLYKVKIIDIDKKKDITTKFNHLFSISDGSIVIGGGISPSGWFYLDGAKKVKKKLIDSGLYQENEIIIS